MATQKQIEANQRNAARGTGPKTPEGKAVSSKNALKTGLLSRELILPDESRAEFDALFAQLVQEHRPVGVLETSLLERVAIAIWRQRRFVRAERAQICKEMDRTPQGAKQNRDDKVLPQHQIDLDLTMRVLKGLDLLPDQLDALENECRLLHLARDLNYDRFQKAYPLLAHFFPRPEPSFFPGKVQTVGACYGDRSNNDLVPLQTRWLTAISQHRENLANAESLGAVNAIPPGAETLSRYQAALDNEWYKAMRAFREAQSYRLKTLVQVNPAKD